MATTAQSKDGNTKQAEPKGAGRSASYPWINLETAETRAKEYWDKEKTYEAPLSAAFKHWGYGPKSSGARLTIAAMLNYGLMSARGSKEKRVVKLTPVAIDLVMAPTPDAKVIALKTAAQKPRIFADLLKTMNPENLPSDQTIAHFLVTQKGFNPNAIETFLKNFKASLKYSKLKKSDIMSIADSSSDGEEDENDGGSLVKEVNLLDAVAGNKPAPIRGFKQDTYTLGDEGQVILQWPEKMSEAAYEELEDWIKLQMRKIARINSITPKKKKE